MDYLSLCLICKDENDYLPEWLDYHIAMGVDRFYIYDNDSHVSLRKTLKTYLQAGWVRVIDAPGANQQLAAYDHCLQTFGPHTRWLGFIDTDEFLLPKTAPNLPTLLQEYESFAGLAVSSLFFGSGPHKTRPASGQLAAYCLRTPAEFKENELVKSIVQPAHVLFPNSPHDFLYRENAWCVNENFERVDGQRFPNRIAKIQLNHYYCRSSQEIDAKLRRGNAQSVALARQRFDAINARSTVPDSSILESLATLCHTAALEPANPGAHSRDLLNKIAALARLRTPLPTHLPPAPLGLSSRAAFSAEQQLKSQVRQAIQRDDLPEVQRLKLLRLQMAPGNILLLLELASTTLDLGDFSATWQILSQAWQSSPNNYLVLHGMLIYFLRIENFPMAENTSRLLLQIAPHDLTTQALLTHSLLAQQRWAEALQVGLPVLELAADQNNLPEGMAEFLLGRLSAYLTETHDYPALVRLWRAGCASRPGDLQPQVQLARALLLAGLPGEARQLLIRLPRQPQVLDLLTQADAALASASDIS